MRRPGASFFSALATMFGFGHQRADARQVEHESQEEKAKRLERLLKRSRTGKFRGRYHRKLYGGVTRHDSAARKLLKPPAHHVQLKSLEQRKVLVRRPRVGMSLFISKQRSRLDPTGTDPVGLFKAYMGQGRA